MFRQYARWHLRRMAAAGLIGLAAALVYGGTDQWTPSGPPGHATAMTSDTGSMESPSAPRGFGTLYAVTSAGFYRSGDHGESWTLVNTEMASERVRALAADPQVYGRVTAVGCGAYQSSNGGVDWIPIDRGLPPGCSLLTLELDTRRPEYLFASGPSGLYVSDFDSSGLFWKPSGQGFFHGPVVVALSEPFLGSQRLYAAPQEGGFFYSLDRGEVWTPTAGAPPGARIRQLRPLGGTTVVAITDRGLFATYDSGNTWGPFFPAVLELSINSYRFVRHASYAATDTGIYRWSAPYSFSPGTTPGDPWKPFSSGLPSGTAISRVFTDPTGRFLCALPASGDGTYIYRYGNPRLNFRPPSVTALVNQSLALQLEVAPEQPERVPLMFEFSDPQALWPWPGASLEPFLTSSPAPVSVRRASPNAVILRVKAPKALGGSETSASVTLLNPVPSLIGLQPRAVKAGDPGFTLFVFDDRYSATFIEGATVLWNGSPRATVSRISPVCPSPCASWLEATIPASDIAEPGTATVTVSTPSPGGGLSNALTLAIAPVHARPPVARPPARPQRRVRGPRSDSTSSRPWSKTNSHPIGV